ncbi:hypothetical protein JQX13_23300 [Archangium violaceum]|uniref:hypothetical protein n=1 Tax=Archangium violaceum TaxID=83451 RepID=UPI00193B7213|nr:hypothetical protein [Archangium violaceum]QRK12699.1 hypothetical protein JQX13_23300 [Archangium violaceum]
MLTIRDAQLQSLQRHREQDFVRSLAAYVRRHEPALVAQWPDALLERRVAHARERAAAYGMTDPFALVEFFVAMAMHSPDFDKHPSVQAILQDRGIAPDHRIHAVWVRTPPETWARIREESSPTPWPCDEETSR